ncbi:hypothetical protein BC351_12130 [Paenibacillus ferrarius]|uniref:FHA domain-containing protein n=1 Tax=Paenibacillus ferrarius TaxID=1469647 RepID=A0A1V4H7Y6_9BACL|nr:DUF6382 domain-containing protein [Paenibacillus ferrarius]OPH47244.1 hypothetical protein BC351_12130 [Paenibacillus ferrarius]
MTQEVFGLRYEFVYNHGHYMALHKEHGLEAKELSMLQVKMLEANDIPNLLPLEIQEIDFRISLLYNISSKRMLAHVVKIEGLSKLKFAKMMVAIVSTLEANKNYMLNEEGYVLKENFIFMGAEWSDIYLTYIPIEPLSEDQSVTKSLALFMDHMLLALKDEERNEVNAILTACTSMHRLQDYKDFFLQLMDKQTVVPKELAAPVNHQYELETDRTYSDPPHPEQFNNLPKPHLAQQVDYQSEPQKWNQNAPNVQQDEQVVKAVKADMQSTSFTPLTQRSQLIALAVVILLSAFVWQNYFTYPSTETLHVTAGITIILADIWLVLKFLGLPMTPQGGQHQTFTPSGEIQAESIVKSQFPEGDEKLIDVQNYYDNLHQHTSLLHNKLPNATVFLGNVKLQAAGPRIEVKTEDNVRTISITNDHFTIGRGDANIKVDCVLEEAGVSRIHTEIIKKEISYEIQDAGSTNGTYLNGELLVAYQRYPLKDGDEIRIVRQEIRFRL